MKQTLWLVFSLFGLLCLPAEARTVATAFAFDDHGAAGLCRQVRNTPDTAARLVLPAAGGKDFSRAGHPARSGCPAFMDIPYAEDFDSYGDDAYLPCWARLGNGDPVYPQLSDEQSSSGAASLQFYTQPGLDEGDDDYYACAISPAIDTETTPVAGLSVSFKILWPYSFSELIVGVMADTADLGTFVAVDTIAEGSFAEGVWVDCDVDFGGYAGAGNRIAFLAPAGLWAYFFIDDVLFYTTPSCKSPSGLAVVGFTDSEATVDWVPRSGEGVWQVAAGPRGAGVEAAAVADAAAHPYTFHVTGNTAYDVYVRGICGEADTSAWAGPVSFTSLCAPVSVDLPYSEDFEGCDVEGGALPECWLRYGSMPETSPVPSQQYAASGGKSLYFKSQYDGYSILLTPALDLSAHGAGTLMLSCRTLSDLPDHGRLDIGYMTGLGDTAAFVRLKSVYASDYSDTGVFCKHNVILDEAFPEAVRFAFLSPEGNGNSFYLDDVRLEEIPSCAEIADMAVTQVAGASALLTWRATDFGECDFAVEVSPAEAGGWSPVDDIAAGHAFIAGLQPLTAYKVRLSALCDGDTGMVRVDSFVTKCLAGGDAVFDAGTSAKTNLPFNAWFNYNYTQQIFRASEMGGAAHIHGIRFRHKSEADVAGKDSVDIYMAHTARDGFVSGGDWMPADSAFRVYSGPLNCTQGWSSFSFTVPFDYNGEDNLVLIVDDNSNSGAAAGWDYNEFYAHPAEGMSLWCHSNQQDCGPALPPAGTVGDYRSDVVFLADCDETVTCVTPNVRIASVGADGAVMEWAPGFDETIWEIEYRPADDTVWNSAGTVEETYYEFSGLSPATAYEVRIRPVCAAESGAWTALAFATECESVAGLPYTESFDGVAGGQESFVPCWTRGTNDPSSPYHPCLMTNHCVSAPNALYFSNGYRYYSYAATGRFDDAVAMDSLQIAFQMYMPYIEGVLEIGIMTDPNDFSTFSTVATAVASEAAVWEQQQVTTGGYRGRGHYLAFRVPQWFDSGIYIDDVTVRYIPGCPQVGDLAVDNITGHSATVTFTSSDEAYEWEYVYGPAGTVSPDGVAAFTAGQTWIELQGLEQNTEYEVMVRSACGGGEYSPWETVAFRTACGDIAALPFSEPFDSYGTGYGVYPVCWHLINYSNQVYVHTTHHSAPASLSMSAVVGSPSYIIMPSLAPSVAAGALQVAFQFRTTGNSAVHPTLIVGVMDDPADTATFTPVGTVTNEATNQWYAKTVSLASYTGSGRHVAFKYQVATSGRSYLDDVVLDYAPACDAPTGLAVSGLTSGTAELSWQVAEGGQAWQVVVAAAVEPDYSQPAEVSAPYYAITGLEANTAYRAYVRTVCDDGGYSVWAAKDFMTVTESPAQVPYCQAFDEDGENGSWVLVNGSGANKWHIGTASNLPETALFVSDDNGATNAYSFGAAAKVWAYRDIQLGDGAEFVVTFKWKAAGHSYLYTNFDYLRFCMGAPMQVEAGVSSVPEGAAIVSDELCGRTEWTTETFTLDATYANTVQRMYFLWNNNAVDGNNPPAAVDSVQVTVGLCGRPVRLNVADVTANEATADFEPASADDYQWQYAAGRPGFNPDSADVTDVDFHPFVIDGLEEGTDYEVYVRTVCDGGDLSSWSEAAAFTTGTVVECVPPTGLAAHAAATTVTLTWNETGSFEVACREAQAQVWPDNMAAEGNSAAIDGLTPGTAYIWRVRQVCDGAVVSDWAEGSFHTLEAPADTCPMPAGLAFSQITGTTVTLAWQQDGDVPDWTLNYRKNTGNAEWTTAVISENPYTLTDLENATEYAVQLRANCADGQYSEYTDIVTFTTTGIVGRQPAGPVTLCPNPATSYIDVRCDDGTQVGGLQVADVYGRLLPAVTGGGNPARIDVSDLAAGVYLVRILTDKGVVNLTFVKK